jgi:hypothetical protein
MNSSIIDTKKRKISEINEIRFKNNQEFIFYISIDDEIESIKKYISNNFPKKIKYPIKLMPIGAIFEYNNMIYQFIQYNNITENVIAQVLKDGYFKHDNKYSFILNGQVLELESNNDAYRLYNYTV